MTVKMSTYHVSEFYHLVLLYRDVVDFKNNDFQVDKNNFLIIYLFYVCDEILFDKFVKL
jgi:hypothetical protein